MFPAVTRLRQIVSLLLLALWLPATLHCDLEAAGLAPTAIACADETHAPATSGHADDSCGLIENSTYKSALTVVKAPAPTLLACCLCCVAALTPEPLFVPLVSPERSDTPPELTRTWQFRSRAALPARAPGLNAVRA